MSNQSPSIPIHFTIEKKEKLNKGITKRKGQNLEDYIYHISGMGTIICGNYKGNPVMILARENDKSTPIQNEIYNGSKIEGVYEDFGGATKKEKKLKKEKYLNQIQI